MPELPKSEDRHTPTQVGLGPGDVLGGQFRLERTLGAGGMGQVFLAHDEHLDRAVAVKVLPEVLSRSKRAAKALRREAARAIELSHPHIGRVHYFGEHHGQPFVVMEFVEGESLADRLDSEETLGLPAALEVLEGVAAALDHAHGEGVVHRDVKPSNILLRAKNGAPVLIDFGIASEVRDQTTRAGQTEVQGAVGTLSYMSPEQVRGKRPRPSMDVYALAATAYELLCGDPPFCRGDPLNIQFQILNEPPEVLEGVPPEVNAALARGLAKDPAARFARAGDLVRAMRGEVVPGGGAPPAEGSGRDVAREAATQVGGLVPVDSGGAALRPAEASGAAVAAAAPGATLAPAGATGGAAGSLPAVPAEVTTGSLPAPAESPGQVALSQLAAGLVAGVPGFMGTLGMSYGLMDGGPLDYRFGRLPAHFSPYARGLQLVLWLAPMLLVLGPLLRFLVGAVRSLLADLGLRLPARFGRDAAAWAGVAALGVLWAHSYRDLYLTEQVGLVLGAAGLFGSIRFQHGDDPEGSAPRRLSRGLWVASWMTVAFTGLATMACGGEVGDFLIREIIHTSDPFQDAIFSLVYLLAMVPATAAFALAAPMVLPAKALEGLRGTVLFGLLGAWGSLLAVTGGDTGATVFGLAALLPAALAHDAVFRWLGPDDASVAVEGAGGAAAVEAAPAAAALPAGKPVAPRDAPTAQLGSGED